MTSEYRRIVGVEWREHDDGPGMLSGVAMRYGNIADLPWGRERFEPGSIYPAPDGVILNRQHDRGRPLARHPDGGLTLDLGADGVGMAASIADTADGRDTVALVRARVLRGLSVEFIPERERMDGDLRIIERGRLVGIAVVDDGAYDASTVKAMRAKLRGSGGIGQHMARGLTAEGIRARFGDREWL